MNVAIGPRFAPVDRSGLIVYPFAVHRGVLRRRLAQIPYGYKPVHAHPPPSKGRSAISSGVEKQRRRR